VLTSRYGVFFIHSREAADDDPFRVALIDLLTLEHTHPSPILKASPLTTAERLAHPYRNRDVALEADYRAFSTSSDMLEVGPLNLDIMLNAAQLRASHSGLKLPDAIHLATALAFGCSRFLTAEKRLEPEYKTGFRYSHPYFVGRTDGLVTVSVVQLSIDTVKAIIEEFKV
jgi:predicted nucleic acid-binding protein